MEGHVNYTLRVHSEANGERWAEVVELPGCFASGFSDEELRESLEEAVSLYLSTPGAQVTFKVVELGTAKPVVEEQRLELQAV